MSDASGGRSSEEMDRERLNRKRALDAAKRDQLRTERLCRAAAREAVWQWEFPRYAGPTG